MSTRHDKQYLYRLNKFLYRGWVALFLCIFLATPYIAVSCNSNTSPVTLFFPVLKEPETVYPAALARGTLVLEDNCLRLKPHSLLGDSSLIIWPYGYTFTIDGEQIHVVDNHGQVVASVGDSIKAGGGQITLAVVEKYIGGPLPDNCPGPYFLTSGVTTD